ncbi:hypothetical protein F4823DRAFT_602705 [Ustulina deusta]|nr:hypothetical protein F4823DRAFT_602705 [Ustulina deusta]
MHPYLPRMVFHTWLPTDALLIAAMPSRSLSLSAMGGHRMELWRGTRFADCTPACMATPTALFPYILSQLCNYYGPITPRAKREVGQQHHGYIDCTRRANSYTLCHLTHLAP